MKDPTFLIADDAAIKSDGEDAFRDLKPSTSIAQDRWLNGPLRDLPRDLLLSERSRRRGILDTTAVERLLADSKRRGIMDLPVWTLLSFEMWCRTFLDQRPRAVASIPRGVRHKAPPPWDGARRPLIA